MILYHGSAEIVKQPRIIRALRTLDYGQGFYTTSSLEQAQRWALRKTKDAQRLTAYVNTYEYDEVKAKSMNIRTFVGPTEEWLEFIIANRTKGDFTHDYDIVVGPVANDKTFASFALFESGVYDAHDLIRALKTYVLVDQYLFHTERALSAITFKDVMEVTA
ncbi:MAG: DUF3990 domain-containing protein [Muribaculaceae bacterium]|nr:DUF3990 domain-containing protein [Muribaculaceae bacterium]